MHGMPASPPAAQNVDRATEVSPPAVSVPPSTLTGMRPPPQLAVRAPLPLAPLGARGDRPVFLGMDVASQIEALKVPGVKQAPGGVFCSFDQIAAVHHRLGHAAPVLPHIPSMDLPGLAEYDALGIAHKLRPYQPPMAAFLATRTMAICTDPLRSGKTVSTIAAAIARGLGKVLILCPALAKLVWASEIAKFTGQRTLILYGRSALRARWFCLTCKGSGFTGGGKCPDCRIGSVPVRGTADETDDDVDLVDPDESKWRAQKLAVIDALHEARWVVCNYDLLVSHTEKQLDGKRVVRADLPGWMQTLSLVKFEGAIADEAHLLRGIAKRERKGLTKRDRADMTCAQIPVVWALTGTPFFGKTADGYGLFDFVTKGLFGRPHFDFDVAYCGGGFQTVQSKRGDGPTQVRYWSRKGLNRTNLPELQSRLSVLMWGRPRSEIQPYMPPKTRQLVRVEVDGQAPIKVGGAKGIAAGLRKTCSLKQPKVIEAVLDELAEGNKTIVYTFLRVNAESAAKALEARAKSREWAGRMKQSNLRIWLVHGDLSPEQRFKQAEAFREWQGAAVWIATMDSVPGMISLKGATTVHFLDLHHDPTTMLQAEERSYEEGTTGLAVQFYIAAGTIDEHAVAILLPKLEQLEAIMRDKNAGDLRVSLGGIREEDMAQAIWDRLMSSLDKVIV